MFNDIRILLGSHRKKLILPIFILILDVFFSMIFYGVFYKTIESLMNDNLSYEKIAVFAIILLLGFILRVVSTALGFYQFNSRTADLIKTMRISMGERLKGLNLGYFNKNAVGDLVNVMIGDVQEFERVLSGQLGNVIRSVFLTLYVGSILFIIHNKLALIQITIIVMGIPLVCLAGLKVEKLNRRKKEELNNVISRILEYLNGIKVFKSHNKTGERFGRLKNSFDNFRKDSIKLEVSVAPLAGIFSIIVDLSFPIILLSGMYSFINNEISSESYIMFLILSIAFTNIVRTFSLQYTEMKYLKVSSSKLVKTYTEKGLEYKHDEAKFKDFNIEFENVSFQYEEGKPVLDDLSFIAGENTLTALVGLSGSGKTTITSLIARFWDVNKGKVKIGGIDISEIKPDELLKHISMVFQDVYLLNDSIYNNIKVGNQSATKEEVIEAAKKANCYDFIMNMPQGFDTVIGEGGNTLSGGEKQRVSIARALLKDAPIVLLDEATSSLDVENELEIKKAIRNLVKDKTVIVIAHRLNTIEEANQIIVLKEGEIIEKGSHDNLINNKGYYYNMHKEMVNSHAWTI